MKMPHRSIAPLLLALSALFSQAPALATAPARAESGSATAAAGTEKPKRSFWDILHFRKKADEPSQEGPAPVPEAPAPAPKKRAAAVAAAPEAPKAVEAAGAFSVVVEIVARDASQRITAALGIPTIGIGSGEHCDGQILVTHDLIGLFPWFTPKFVHPEAQVGAAIRDAVQRFVTRTRAS
jgi:hypothetical protein